MLYCVPSRASKIFASQSFRFQCAISISLILLFALSTGCGSHSPSTQTPTPSASAGLNLSGSLASASVGAGYSSTVAATGGTAPYNFSVSSGQLPSGTGLATDTGNISGTPSAAGSFNFGISVSDSKGQYAQKSFQIVVASNSTTTSGGTGGGSGGGQGSGGQGSTGSQPPAGTSLSNLQRSGGWNQFGQGPPNFVDCSPSPCDGISFWMGQNINSPSLSGNASEFNVGGTTPYSDALWVNHLVGPNSTQGLPDDNQSMTPSLHNFTYDVYFYGDNFGLSQALEFDINQFFDNMGFIFGHECRILSGNQWDVWDNENAHWVPTGVPCYPNNNSWNHLTLQVQRTSDNHLVYQSITLNGQTANLNWTFGHGSSPNWYGLTINYQMDGDQRQDSYNVYLDNLTFTYN